MSSFEGNYSLLIYIKTCPNCSTAAAVTAALPDANTNNPSQSDGAKFISRL